MDPTRRGFLATAATTLEQRRPAVLVQAEPQTTKEAHEFFDPADLPWHPAPGFALVSGADRKRRSR